MDSMKLNIREALVNSGKSVHGPSIDKNPPTGDGGFRMNNCPIPIPFIATDQNYYKGKNMDEYCLKNERFKLFHKVKSYYKTNAPILFKEVN